MGKVHTLLEGYVLSQKKFTNELLKDSGLKNFMHIVTALLLNLKLQKDLTQPFEDPTKSRCLVAWLDFLTNTQPGLSFMA